MTLRRCGLVDTPAIRPAGYAGHSAAGSSEDRPGCRAVAKYAAEAASKTPAGTLSGRGTEQSQVPLHWTPLHTAVCTGVQPVAAGYDRRTLLQIGDVGAVELTSVHPYARIALGCIRPQLSAQCQARVDLAESPVPLGAVKTRKGVIPVAPGYDLGAKLLFELVDDLHLLGVEDFPVDGELIVVALSKPGERNEYEQNSDAQHSHGVSHIGD